MLIRQPPPMDDTVKRWRLQGDVYLWRYKGNARNYPGWHLTADTPGCASLLELIDLMRDSQFLSEAPIRLSQPTLRQISVPNAPLEHDPAKSLAVYHSPKLVADHWRLSENDGRVRLEVGHDSLSELRKGIADVARHEGDYSIGATGQALWFWWS
jgi:hypothetical protein